MTFSKVTFIKILTIVSTTFLSCNNGNTNNTVPTTSSNPKDTATVVKETPPPSAPQQSYTLVPMKGNDSLFQQLKKLSHEEKVVLEHLNRIDFHRIRNLDTLLLPNTIDKDLMTYSPFPATINAIKDVKKIVYFSYPKQAYAVYESGKLIKWGASSLGKKATKTPTGLFFTNWKGRKITSTVNSSWILEYNFNVSNQGGVGWHKYDMPGYPASHSCMRLFMDDAKWLYDYADQWRLENDQVIAKGTPVIIYGEYPWGERKPWRHLADNPSYLQISEEDITKETTPHLEKILKEQEIRAKLLSTVDSTANPT